jgi:hypothetical protein
MISNVKGKMEISLDLPDWGVPGSSGDSILNYG